MSEEEYSYVDDSEEEEEDELTKHKTAVVVPEAKNPPAPPRHAFSLWDTFTEALESDKTLPAPTRVPHEPTRFTWPYPDRPGIQISVQWTQISGLRIDLGRGYELTTPAQAVAALKEALAKK